MLACPDICDAPLFPVKDQVRIVIFIALFAPRSVFDDLDGIVLEAPAAALGDNVGAKQGGNTTGFGLLFIKILIAADATQADLDRTDT